MIRLYRCITSRDKENGYRLTSKTLEVLTNTRAMEEIVSHELNATTGRGIYYSFSPCFELVKAYSERNPDNAGICYIDINPTSLDPAIKRLDPVYLRDYLLCLIASSPEILNSGELENPSTMRVHSIAGLLNVSQRSVAAWAYSMREVMLQCDNLKLNPCILDEEKISQDAEEIDKILMTHFAPLPDEKSIAKLREILVNSFHQAGLKRNWLLERVHSDSWFDRAC